MWLVKNFCFSPLQIFASTAYASAHSAHLLPKMSTVAFDRRNFELCTLIDPKKEVGVIDMEYKRGALRIVLNKPVFVFPFALDKYGKEKAVVAIDDRNTLKFLKDIQAEVTRKLSDNPSIEVADLIWVDRNDTPCVRLTLPRKNGERLPLDGSDADEIVSMLEGNMNQCAELEFTVRLWYTNKDGKTKVGFYNHIDSISV